MDKPLSRFLNVDLDIHSKSSLQGLVDAMGERAFVHYQGREGRRYGAHLSLPGGSKNPDEAILGLASLVRRLPKTGRKLWDEATIRAFNIGIQAESTPQCYELMLSPETVRAVAVLKGRIAVTVYAPRKESSVHAQRAAKRAGRRTTR